MAWWDMFHVPLRCTRDDSVEVVLGHVPDHALAQHAGRVDDEIDFAERVRALAHHAASAEVVGDRIVIGKCLAAGLGDFRHHLVRRALGRDLAATAGAGIVDDDAGAFPGHQQCDAATDAATGSRDDAGLTFEIHRGFSRLVWLLRSAAGLCWVRKALRVPLLLSIVSHPSLATTRQTSAKHGSLSPRARPCILEAS